MTFIEIVTWHEFCCSCVGLNCLRYSSCEGEFVLKSLWGFWMTCLPPISPVRCIWEKRLRKAEVILKLWGEGAGSQAISWHVPRVRFLPQEQHHAAAASLMTGSVHLQCRRHALSIVYSYHLTPPGFTKTPVRHCYMTCTACSHLLHKNVYIYMSCMRKHKIKKYS